MRIGEREIGHSQPPYIIGEIGVNHDGSCDRALQLIDAAAAAGADAIKLQYFETDRLLSRAARLAGYQAAAGETDPSVMLRRLELPLGDMERVIARAHERSIHAIVTVFSVELVAPARALAWDAFKSASPDIIHRPLLDALAADGRPLVTSTGASTLDEVERALKWLAGASDRLALLQCVSAYPAPTPAFEGIAALRAIFDGPVGYSDHTLSAASAASAVRAGACILEKHLTWSRAAPGPDHAASLEPAQFAEYVRLAHEAVPPTCSEVSGAAPPTAAGVGAKHCLPCESDVRSQSRQSVTTTRALSAGHTLRREDLTFKRPGAGIAPWRLDEVMGRPLAADVEADAPLQEHHVATWEQDRSLPSFTAELLSQRSDQGN
jgi:N,N'-diacetyllegionaminate synthase